MRRAVYRQNDFFQVRLPARGETPSLALYATFIFSFFSRISLSFEIQIDFYETSMNNA